MRRYKIEIEGGDTYDSAPNGQSDPGALLVEMDMTVGDYSIPLGSAFVRIWGVGVQALSQARDLYNKKIKVWGGMAKGLPLAKPEQYGLLVQGKIFKAFGNWEDVNQSLDLFISADADAPKPDGGPNPKPAFKNLVLNAPKGTNLIDALKKTLQTAYPDYKIDDKVKKQIIVPQDQIHYSPTLPQLAYYIRRISQDIIGGNYEGVSIFNPDGVMHLADSADACGQGEIGFEDLVGQPTWIDTGVIQFKTTMRSDIKLMYQITLPKTWINSSEAANDITPNSQQQLAFQGKFKIQKIRHVGNSRSPVGSAWVTVFDANFLGGGS